EALSSEDADINKNGSVSVQEAFDYADRKVADYFSTAGRLATEHPQLRGENAPRLNLARLDAAQQTPVSEDPEINRLIERRQQIDVEIEELQLNREDYSGAEYTQRLRDLILESATV